MGRKLNLMLFFLILMAYHKGMITKRSLELLVQEEAKERIDYEQNKSNIFSNPSPCFSSLEQIVNS